MKKNCTILLFCMAFIFQTMPTVSQGSTSVKELILETQALKANNIQDIFQQLSALDGVQLRGYHSGSQSLLITYDSLKIADPTIIITIVEHLNKGFCVMDAFYENLYSFIERIDSKNEIIGIYYENEFDLEY